MSDLKSVCRAKFAEAGLDWALPLIGDDSAVIELASLNARDVVSFLDANRHVFVPKLLRLAREAVQDSVRTPEPDSPSIPLPGEESVVVFTVVGASTVATDDSLEPLAEATLAKESQFVTFYGSSLVDDDAPALKKLLSNLKTGGWVDLSFNRFTTASFDFVYELADKMRATVFVGGNPLASIESREKFQPLFDAAVNEMKAFVKDTNSSTATLKVLRRIIFVPVAGWLQSDNWKAILTNKPSATDPEEQRARELVFGGIVASHRSYLSDVHYLMRSAAKGKHKHK
jgi:hypothetical protein